MPSFLPFGAFVPAGAPITATIFVVDGSLVVAALLLLCSVIGALCIAAVWGRGGRRPVAARSSAGREASVPFTVVGAGR